MPRQTVQKRAFKHLEKDLEAAENFLLQKYLLEESKEDECYDADNDEDSDSDLDEGLLAFLSTKEELEDGVGTRYLLPRGYAKSKTSIFEEDLNPSSSYFISNRKFKTKYRVSRQSLDKIAAKIADHSVFKSKTCQQAPVAH